MFAKLIISCNSSYAGLSLHYSEPLAGIVVLAFGMSGQGSSQSVFG